MKIVLTCGHPFSGIEQAEQILSAAGVKPAEPSRRETLSPYDLQTKIASAFKVNLLSGAPLEQVMPGKMWQELAVDLFMANQDLEQWGWSDPQTSCLLDFWREFDPQIRFVLVYSAPEYTVGQQLRNCLDPAPEIKAALAAWFEVNSQLLSFYNRYQDRCLLVNAAALRTDPASFTEKAAKLFCLELSAAIPKHDFHGQTDAAITATLAKKLVADCEEATSLYNELESSADLSLTTSAQAKQGRFFAWQEYVSQVARFERETAEAKKANERVLTATRDEATNKAEADNKEKELLKLQLDQIQEELEHYLLRCQEFEKADNEKDELLTDYGKLKADIVEAAKENELLLLQLHQVQEELEHYFILYQELSQKHKQYEEEDGRLRDRLLLDLRSDFDGYNWYDAETEGRWAGPGTTSSIRFPQLAPGEYLLELDINNAMSHDIMQEMEVSFNDSVIEFDITSKLPVMLTSRIVQRQLDAASVNMLQFKFPKVISPVDHGSDDQRRLAIQPIYLSIKNVKYVAETPAQVDMLNTLADNMTQLAEERRFQLEQALYEKELFAQKLDQQTGLTSQKQSELAEISKEKDLLLIQLQNIQEVQEHYSSLYHKLEQQNIRYLRNSLEIDFKNDFDGDNWYDSETDGRWAGPETTSSIRIPQLMPGAYCLELEIVDSMAPEIFKNMEIIFNGTSVEIEKARGKHDVLSRLFKGKKRNMGIVRARLDIGPSDSTIDQELQFKFTNVITPADHGSNDQRYLAVKCSNLTIKRYI